jgi:hypothetical protein
MWVPVALPSGLHPYWDPRGTLDDREHPPMTPPLVVPQTAPLQAQYKRLKFIEASGEWVSSFSVNAFGRLEELRSLSIHLAFQYTCFPSNDSGDPMERVVGVCQTGSYGIHRIPLSYRLKVRQRCADRHREVPAPTGCNAHVFAEDGRPLLWRDQHEVNTAPKSLANNGVAMCSLDVLHPVRLRAEHRHEIAFALHGGDYHRIRAPATGPASTDF